MSEHESPSRGEMIGIWSFLIGLYVLGFFVAITGDNFIMGMAMMLLSAAFAGNEIVTWWRQSGED